MILIELDDYASIDLTDDELAVITRPVRGKGGFQSLLKALRRNMEGSRLNITPSLAQRIVRYATRYGCGGFQDRLRRIVAAAERV